MTFFKIKKKVKSLICFSKKRVGSCFIQCYIHVCMICTCTTCYQPDTWKMHQILFLWQGRGGQSALRFARLRMEKRHNYVRKVAEVAVQLFISNDRPNIAGLVLAGSADFKTELSQSEMFDQVKPLTFNKCFRSTAFLDGLWALFPRSRWGKLSLILTWSGIIMSNLISYMQPWTCKFKSFFLYMYTHVTVSILAQVLALPLWICN